MWKIFSGYDNGTFSRDKIQCEHVETTSILVFFQTADDLI